MSAVQTRDTRFDHRRFAGLADILHLRLDRKVRLYGIVTVDDRGADMKGFGPISDMSFTVLGFVVS